MQQREKRIDNTKQRIEAEEKIKIVKKKTPQRITRTKKPKPQQTQTVKEYKKQRNRIKNFIKRAERRGFMFDDFDLPKQPLIIATKSVDRLSKINTKDLYKKARFVDMTTGEILTGQEGRALEILARTEKARQTRQAKRNQSQQTTQEYPNFSDIIIANFLADLQHFPKVGAPILTSWLNTLLSRYGKDDVAEMLQTGAENNVIVTWEVAYMDIPRMDYMMDMLNYLPDVGQFTRDELQDIFDELEIDESHEPPE